MEAKIDALLEQAEREQEDAQKSKEAGLNPSSQTGQKGGDA
jgi:hypothetical protein